jgi:release factor glutamine methyltransferase
MIDATVRCTVSRVLTIVDRLRAAGCVFAEDEARVLLESAGTPAALEEMIARRVAGEPLEHVVGWVEFCGLRLAVGPGVFVPRQRTELLVREAAKFAPLRTVVDLACGCGAIGAALTARVPGIGVYAVDIDAASVECARINLPHAQVYRGDLFEPLPPALKGNVDVLVANVPYVPTEAVALMPHEARLYEPRVALDGGTDGLDVLRRVAREANKWLAPGGHVLMEIGVAQVDAAIAALEGLSPAIVHDEDATVVIAERARTASAR